MVGDLCGVAGTPAAGRGWGCVTNVSSLLLVLRAQTGSLFFSFSISPVSKTLRDPFCLLVFKTKVLEVLVSVKGRFAI